MASSYWCYRCSRFVTVWRPQDAAIVCPDCNDGFLEVAETPPRIPNPFAEPRHRQSMIDPTTRTTHNPADIRHRRHPRAGTGDHSPFNPVIVLRGPSDGAAAADAHDRAMTSRFELYYDDGAGSGLRPLPATMSEFLMGSGFERLLDQLVQIEINAAAGSRGFDHPPASKSAVESMPTIEIADFHVNTDSYCAVCKDPFEIGSEAREMPGKHIYHQDCILPWLSLRNSCPVCRHEMPTDVGRRRSPESENDELAPVGGAEEEAVGLTIWRLPGGGFAVGRFSRGREIPVVYTEMDGGFNSGGERRRISWTSRGSRARQSGGTGRAFRNFFSFFGRRRSSSSSSNSL